MGVVENMKDVSDLVRKFNDIELNRRILNLENEVLDLSRDKRRAEEKIEELERALKFKEQLVFKDSFYWLEGDRDPFCPACWELKKVPVHVVTKRMPEVGFGLHCPVCKSDYRPHRTRAEPPNQPMR